MKKTHFQLAFNNINSHSQWYLQKPNFGLLVKKCVTELTPSLSYMLPFYPSRRTICKVHFQSAPKFWQWNYAMTCTMTEDLVPSE